MAHIVFIVGSYIPNLSAVGGCAKNIIDELKHNHQITVISIKTSFEEPNNETIDSYNIYRVSSRLLSCRLFFEFKKKKSGQIGKSLYSTAIIFYKLIRFIESLLGKVNLKKDIIKSYYNALIKVEKKARIDIIIPCSFPFESVKSSFDFVLQSKYKIKLIPYFFDNFVDSISLHRTKLNKHMKRNKHIELTKKIISNSHKILALNTLRNHFLKNFEIYNDKICYLEHPLLKKKEFSIKVNHHDKLILTYTGSLIKGYVSPVYLLQVIKKLILKIDITMNFFVMGNDTEIVDDYVKEFPGQITNYGRVSYDEAQIALYNSDILINISEKSGKQISSKLFNYISLGKPLINFYTSDDDENVKLLERYSLSCCIKEDILEINSNIKKIVDFIAKNKNQILDYNSIEQNYFDAIPKYSANKIIELLN